MHLYTYIQPAGRVRKWDGPTWSLSSRSSSAGDTQSREGSLPQPCILYSVYIVVYYSVVYYSVVYTLYYIIV